MNPSRLTVLAAGVVGTVQRRLPPDLRPLALAVPVHYEAVPSADVLRDGFEADILGLFTGTPHGRELDEANPSPPQILLYLENIWAAAEGRVEVFRDETRITYLHELGHYLGWDEEDLARRGLD